jgi:chromosome segregation ATPase
MEVDGFICNNSPVHQADDRSESELNVTALSLPESFDDTFCLDLYKDLISEAQPNENRWTTAKDSQAITANTPPHNDTHNEEMESKIRQLLTVNLELKEKGRLYDNLAARYSKREDEVEQLSSKLCEQIKLCESSNSREKELQQHILELKRKKQLNEIDLEHAQKEIVLLTQRAEKSEKEYESSAALLKVIQAKHDNLISQYTAERDELKKRTEAEIARVRSETSQEIILSRNCQKEAFEREIKLLSDAKDYAIEQAKSIQQELNHLRSDRQSKDADTSDIINELERQLADTRGDLKVKTCELNTLQASHEKVTEEIKLVKSEYEKNTQDLCHMQMKQAKLEQILRHKEDELEIYKHQDLLICSTKDRLKKDSNAASMIAKQKSLIKNSVLLTKECRELQSQLSSEKEKNEKLARQAEYENRLYHELSTKTNKNASEYIVAAVNEREKEISRLNTKIQAIQTELDETRLERNDLALKLSEMLERRKNLENMKVMVDKGIKQMRQVPKTEGPRAVSFNGRSLGDVNVDKEDVLEHIVYHNKAISRR